MNQVAQPPSNPAPIPEAPQKPISHYSDDDPYFLNLSKLKPEHEPYKEVLMMLKEIGKHKFTKNLKLAVDNNGNFDAMFDDPTYNY